MSSKLDSLPETISNTLQNLPTSPGVYRFLDKNDKILYIGKAKNLRNRVKSYYSAGKSLSFRIKTMLNKATNIVYTVTETEIEALTLENNLIKENQPRYNIMLKDGKTYPYICIRAERFPRVFGTRKKVADGSLYFGPYPSVRTMNTILSLIRSIYKVRTCKYDLSEQNISAGKFKVCLEYQIGNCLGPCEGKQSEKTYNNNIEAIKDILSGNIGQLAKRIEHEMKSAAAAYKFEEAELLKQKLLRVQAYKRNNTIVSQKIRKCEVLTIASENNISIINHFSIRKGSIIQTHVWELKKKIELSEAEILYSAYQRLLDEYGEVSNEVIANINFLPSEEENVALVKVPQRGEKKKLVELSLKTCHALLDEKIWKQAFQKKNPNEIALTHLKENLGLKTLPNHIECFDNSNFQGSNPVASLVVFKSGEPAKKLYRHFNIKTVEGPDDFKSMAEIVYRRYKRILTEEQSLPDLIIVDGGKGQLSSAANSLKELNLLHKIPLIGIAKRLEEIFRIGDPYPLHLDKKSEGLKLIQRIRDEAHRFAITFHRKQRSKDRWKSELEEIEGIGKETVKKLLRHFKSTKKIRAAKKEELIKVIGKAKAIKLLTTLNKKES